MRILIVSDSHGRYDKVAQAVERTAPDMVLHLGDGASDASRVAHQNQQLRVVQVAGNCDFLSPEPNQRRMEVEDVGLFLCHGHTFGVKQSLLGATYAAREQAAQVLFFGHTHQPLHDNLGDLTIFNPGSIGYDGRYGVMEVEKGVFRLDLKNLSEGV